MRLRRPCQRPARPFRGQPRLLGIAELERREELGTGEQEGRHGIVEELGAGLRLQVPGLEQEVLRLRHPVLGGGLAHGGVPGLAQARAVLSQPDDLVFGEVVLIGHGLGRRGFQVEGVGVEPVFDRRVVERPGLLPLEPAEGQAGAEQVGQGCPGGRGDAGQGGVGGREVRFREQELRAPERLDLAQRRIGGRRGQPPLDLRAVLSLGQSAAQRRQRREAEEAHVHGARRSGRTDSMRLHGRRSGGQPHPEPHSDPSRDGGGAGDPRQRALSPARQQERARGSSQAEREEGQGEPGRRSRRRGDRGDRGGRGRSGAPRRGPARGGIGLGSGTAGGLGADADALDLPAAFVDQVEDEGLVQAGGEPTPNTAVWGPSFGPGVRSCQEAPSAGPARTPISSIAASRPRRRNGALAASLSHQASGPRWRYSAAIPAAARSASESCRGLGSAPRDAPSPPADTGAGPAPARIQARRNTAVARINLSHRVKRGCSPSGGCRTIA